MIRLPDSRVLSATEQFGLRTLVDQSRIVPLAEDASPDLESVRLDVAERDSIDRPSVDVLLDPASELEQRDGVVTVSRRLLRAVTDVAGAGAEQRSTAADRHGRVPSSENPLAARSVERRPLVSEAAVALRQATIAAAGRRVTVLAAPWPEGSRWAVALTHDVDAVAWWPLFTALRVAELARKGEWGRVLRSLGAAARTFDPVRPAVAHLLATERRQRVRATWFLLCGNPTLRSMAHGDLTYRPDSDRARWIVDSLVREQHEPGLHGSFDTMLSADALRAQRVRLTAIAGKEVRGVRQHYLRMRPGRTQAAMCDAGFGYDATFGFPDRNGFRLGVADVVEGWDAQAGERSSLSLVPLTWMDRAMSKYSGVESPDRWVDDALELAESCRSVEGLWVGLWHPNLTAALGYPGAPDAYERLVGALMAGSPYVAPLADIVAWRLSRRALTVGRVWPDGSVGLALARGAREPTIPGGVGVPCLEDAAGRMLRVAAQA